MGSERDRDQMRSGAPERAPSTMRSVVLWIEPSQIMLFKAIIESYDNLATLRTVDPARHHLRLYFGPESEGDVMTLLAAIGGRFSMRLIDRTG